PLPRDPVPFEDVAAGVDDPGVARRSDGNPDCGTRMLLPVHTVPLVDSKPAGNGVGADDPHATVAADGDVLCRPGAALPCRSIPFVDGASIVDDPCSSRWTDRDAHGTATHAVPGASVPSKDAEAPASAVGADDPRRSISANTDVMCSTRKLVPAS